MNIHSYPTLPEATAAAGEYLNELLTDHKKSHILLLLSGGSSLAVLDYVNTSPLGENLTITMLDERFSQEPEINNFLKLQKLDFYSGALAAGVNFIGTLPRPGENLEDMRYRMETNLRTWQKDHPRGKIFAVFGMGSDGHTAGIFPFEEDAQFFSENFENRHYVAGYKADGKHKYPERLTATFPFFKNIDEAILFACGHEKKEALSQLIKGAEQPHRLPALGIYETKNFSIFTDIAL